MPSWVWEPCTLTQTLLFQMASNVQHDQQVYHPLPPSSTINFLGVESPFSIEDGPLWVVWRNYYLLGCIVVFSQLLKYFSKLLAWLMVLLQWGHFSFLIWGSQWYCLNRALFEQNLAYLFHLCLVFSIKHSIGCSICCLFSSVAVNMTSSWLSVKFYVATHCCSLDLKRKEIIFNHYSK